MKNLASETRLLQQKLSSITSHPFVNFFLELCKSRDGLNLDDLAKKAGRLWKEMDISEKMPYYRLARKVKRIAKSKKGRDLARDQMKRKNARVSSRKMQPGKSEKMIERKRKTNFAKGTEPSNESKQDENESKSGNTTDCNSVERYCLDILRRRYSHSSTYESD
ncbi:hypothetical protein WA026_001336 [Henosepilachna vigintioctopunctata]|uniref:HMG box domain-containing protein n=1 Tax=Henosepilachna vigintioctopunctata TaxID=420089 RepID=A0AAW1UQ31_9CUCU